MRGVTLPALPSRAQRRFRAVLAALAAVGFAALLCSLPLLFPSSTSLYKFGWDKTLLNAGKIAGSLAAALLLLQVWLVARLRWLDRAVSLNRQTLLHRWAGAALLGAAVAHPLLIFASEDVTSIPPDWDFWPEVLGAAALVGLAFLSGVTWVRERERLPHHWWRMAHRAGALGLVSLVTVHVLSVTDTYASGWPRWIVIAAAAAAGLGWLRVAGRWIVRPWRYTVKRVALAGNNVFAVDMAPASGKSLAHAPGQFAFLCLAGETLPPDEHPFTIASAPGRGGRLQFIVRCAGDWTRAVGRLQPGQRVYVQGPYGQFTHWLYPQAARFVMVAGGIGVTPMLSMLRDMAARGSTVETLLIWSNRSPEDRAAAQEVEEMSMDHDWLSVAHVYTRQGEPRARLDTNMLARLAGEWRPGTLAFICGPPGMMQSVAAALRELGWPPKALVMEEFRL